FYRGSLKSPLKTAFGPLVFCKGPDAFFNGLLGGPRRLRHRSLEMALERDVFLRGQEKRIGVIQVGAPVAGLLQVAAGQLLWIGANGGTGRRLRIGLFKAAQLRDRGQVRLTSLNVVAHRQPDGR